MSGLEIDFESRSDIDIKKRGAWLYMRSPHTRPLMASYRIDGGPVKRWRPGEPCPADIVAHVAAGGMISAHNASFERLLWQLILTPRYGWPMVRTEQFRCTAVTAAAMGLPRSLDKLGAALGLKTQKDKAGSDYIRQFSVPRRARKGEAPGLYFNEPEQFPADFEGFHDYCDTDVLTEAEADGRMIPLSTAAQELYTLDQRINDRGLRIDRRSVRAALAIAEKAKAKLDKEMFEATGGAVRKCSEVAKLTEWVQAQGVELPSLAKAEIEELLELDDLPPNVRRVVSLRQEAAKTSLSKLTAFLARCDTDGRIRHAFLLFAASTGRWSSVGAQLHNLPRPRKEYGDADLDLRLLFEALREEDPDLLKFLYGEKLGRTLFLLADMIRSFIWAAPGHDLLVADYSGIEGAVAAWFADEEWKLAAMRELIANPKLPDLYRRSAAGIFNVPVDAIPKSDVRRQVGKVSELSLQYQGGVGAFRSMARNYSLKMGPVYAPVWASADQERRDKAVKRYERCVRQGDPMTKLLTREEWLAGELVKIGWRAAHPKIVAAWAALEDAMREAVTNPGKTVKALKVEYLVTRGFLWCRLPSGRCLAYGSPRMKQQVWAKRICPITQRPFEDAEVMGREEALRGEALGLIKIEGETSSAVTAMGVDSATKRYVRFALYGGLAFENVVQAIAFDILWGGVVRAEAAGYPVIGHVHDEIITEVPRGFGDVGAFEALICELDPWAGGLPLTAAGYRAKRYRKD